MKQTIEIIPLLNLALAFLPVGAVLIILWRWQIGIKQSVFAVMRMLIQLLLIGYVLAYIFEANNAWIVIAVLTVMLVSSSWISLRTVTLPKKQLLIKSFLAICAGGASVLVLITQGVLYLQPWFLPSYMVPLAGMIFANAMNSISLAGERLQSEIDKGQLYQEARIVALKASLIPITNSLFAVGLVSLPGMMTGQILSGVSPFIAARYQIMVMCMTFGSAGVSSAVFLILTKRDFENQSALQQS
ncbi:MAG: ABC transporter permease [Bacteroidota bacterium]